MTSLLSTLLTLLGSSSKRKMFSWKMCYLPFLPLHLLGRHHTAKTNPAAARSLWHFLKQVGEQTIQYYPEHVGASDLVYMRLFPLMPGTPRSPAKGQNIKQVIEQVYQIHTYRLETLPQLSLVHRLACKTGIFSGRIPCIYWREADISVFLWLKGFFFLLRS